ncbi:MAG: MBOAT family protein [Xanthobacteraceae bacterium]|nr:MBOAT family protein [Xanthobacteraceae bacterium]
MLFNSPEYIFVFLPAAVVIYFYLNACHPGRPAKIWLVLASLGFYSWWGLIYLPLIVTSIIVNYAVGRTLAQGVMKARAQKLLLVSGLTFNLGLLGYFKYANFFIDNFDRVTGASAYLAPIILPLAISFFTFQKIGFLVDSYKGETRGYNFLDYALFVTFFPQLIAGPIVHHKQIVPQFADAKNAEFNASNFGIGLCMFGIGLCKKIVIADTFAAYATPGFDGTKVLTFAEAWLTSLSYTFQLYFDFSGYTDMAIGSALLFNIRLPKNFESPYKALDIQDFWRRWHITLSHFLRDYLYIPLGGNRHGDIRTGFNLFLTFLLGGLWHGASWMFVAWGAMHGLAMIVNRIWTKTGLSLPAFAAWLLTFNFVNFAWIFFRAKDLDAAARVLRGMTDFSSIAQRTDNNGRDIAIWSAAAFGVVLLGRTTLTLCTDDNAQTVSGITAGAAFAVALLTMFAVTSRVSEFIYFNF